MEKLVNGLLLIKFVKLEILSTSFIDFLSDKLGELRPGSLDHKGFISVYRDHKQKESEQQCHQNIC